MNPKQHREMLDSLEAIRVEIQGTQEQTETNTKQLQKIQKNSNITAYGTGIITGILLFLLVLKTLTANWFK